MMIKQGFRLLLLFIFVLFLSFQVFAAESISVYIDNEKLEFRSDPVIKNDRTLVPMREIFEKLGYQVTWNEKEKSIIGTNNSTNIEMTLNRSIAKKNNKNIVLETAPILIDSITMVPLRFVAESTDANVEWISKTRTVHITSLEEQNRQVSLEDSVVLIQAGLNQGSGVILRENGLIVTNYHVLEASSSVKVTFQNNRIYTGPVSIVGYNTSKDLVAFKIDAFSLHPVRLGDSSNLSINQEVITIGSPLGSKNIKTTGKILSLDLGIIRFDAPIDYGSSGGALFNTNGELIGITSATNQFYSYFAIPVNHVKKLSTKGDFLLTSLTQLNAVPSQVENLSVHYEGNRAYLSWDYEYGASYFYVYKQNPTNGKFEREINPSTKNYEWYWGYPYSFGLDITYMASANYKIASVKNGQVSPLSETVKVVGNLAN